MKVGYDGLSYNTVTEIENYRFHQIWQVDKNHNLSTIYFILNFNKTTIIDGKEYATEVLKLICEVFVY